MTITLRRWSGSDAAFYAASGKDPLIQRFTTEERNLSEETARQRLTDLDPGLIAFAISDDATGEPVGNIGAKWIDACEGVVEGYYWLAPAARGQGVATTALDLLWRHCLDQYGITRMDLLIDTDNQASRSVAERAGFNARETSVVDVMGTSRRRVRYCRESGPRQPTDL